MEFVELYLCLLSFPCNIYRVNTSYTLHLLETNTKHESSYTAFTKYNWYHSWPRNLLQSKSLETLPSITLEIIIHSLFTEPKLEITLPPNPDPIDRTKNPIQLMQRQESFPRGSYHWIIDDETMVESIQNAPNVYGFGGPIFEIFGFKFYA